ncbi:polyprenol monophosphomannose synthase [Spirulina sp. 06S082]|nr:polyprenol monophosphomannose synthase [Spirulina sp. 06S082]MEA5469726.1 polyprenol monophosphomannose synthase [Spirulina sp. 06S082]
MSQSLLPVPSGRFLIPGATFLFAQEKPLKFSLIIPTYKESQNIRKIVKQLTHLLDRKIPNQYELIIVDDNSPDRTGEIALEVAKSYPQLKVMCRQNEKGLSTAVIRGWQMARGEILGVIDADLQHPPETLLQLYEKMERKADLAVASRHISGGGVSEWSLARRILSRGAQLLGLILVPQVVGRVSDPLSGYFLLRRDAIQGREMNPTGYKILLEVLGRGKIEYIQEVGYIFQERTEGESKVTVKQYLEYIQHLWRLKFPRWSLRRSLRYGQIILKHSQRRRSRLSSLGKKKQPILPLSNSR